MSSPTNNAGNLSCFHLSELRSQTGPHPFHSSPHLRKHHVLQCHTCRHHPHVLTSLYACVTCAELHCTLHAQLHAAAFPDYSHSIAIDVDRIELYCCLCKDQVYDKEFDVSVMVSAAGKFARTPPENTLKRRRVEYIPWEPGQTEKDLITENSTPLPSDQVKLSGNGVDLSSDRVDLSGNQVGLLNPRVELSGGGVEVSGRGVGLLGDSVGLSGDGVELSGERPFPWGLRGLNNLGNTCFMNSVLQALIHTPPLRNYFLSDKHNRYVCKKNTNSVVSMKDDEKLIKEMKDDDNINTKKNIICLACELDAMFSVAFSGATTPFTPAKFLYSWWQHASNLASYEQQDAHEFFISILDGVHEKLQMNQGKPQSQVSSDCCIAHKVFSGILRSDVMCTACGFTSTTYDPCVDISLDLEPNKGAHAKTSKKSKQKSANTDSSQNSKMATLLGCLDRFTRPERLGSDQKFFCQQCQVRQESLKQMSIRKLPMVSCFHIKRFEHSSYRKMTRKVDSYLQFPFSLDLTPYLSSSILKSRFGNRMFYFDGCESDSPNEMSSEFELFAVITHTGRLDAGHYVTYLRLSNQWYKCDDAWITQVSDNVVRASQGYMMFYVQKTFHYKASESSVGS